MNMNLVAEADADGDGPTDGRGGEKARASSVLRSQTLGRKTGEKNDLKDFTLRHWGGKTGEKTHLKDFALRHW